MEKQIICLDTSILIDFFRKSKKENSTFYQLTNKYQVFATSVITEYEIFTRSNKEQEIFWEELFMKIIILPLDTKASRIAIQIFKELKTNRKLIEIPDILIAATAISNDMPLTTLNKKHFERIKNLQIIENI
jgi:predicted nucleic acid-binding protein